MKGIILAGGTGTRLHPVTQVVNKHLLPIYNKPMIYYPLSTLMLMDLTEILIICNKEDLEVYEKLFWEGSSMGIHISYRVQKARGIADGLIIAEDFIRDDDVCLILGDNIFFGHGWEVGPFVEAFNQLGIASKLELIPKSTALMYRQGKAKWATMVSQAGRQDLDATLNMFKAWQLSDKETEIAVKILTEMALMTPEQIDALNDVTVQQWIAQHGDLPKPLFSFLAVQSNLMATGLYELVAIWELAKIMQIFAGSTTCYPKGGYAKLVDDIADVLKACDGDLKLRSRVERIIVENGQVTGVTTKDGVFKAPIVVSNAGIQPTVLKLVGEKHFDTGYVNYVKSIVPSLGFCCQRYIFKEPVMQHGIYIGTSQDSYIDVRRHEETRAGKIPPVVSIYAVNPALFDPDMAPKGKQMLLIGTWCRPDPRPERSEPCRRRLTSSSWRCSPEKPSTSKPEKATSARLRWPVSAATPSCRGWAGRQLAWQSPWGTVAEASPQSRHL